MLKVFYFLVHYNPREKATNTCNVDFLFIYAEKSMGLHQHILYGQLNVNKTRSKVWLLGLIT
jgi:hypothetical protein